MMNQDKNIPQRLQTQRLTDLKTVLAKYFYHWPLFLICFLLAISAAAVYLQLTKPVYEISAVILVKDEKKSPKEKSGLEEIDLSSSPKNAETEIQVITSKNLIGQVVKDLGLNVSYATGDFNQQEHYKDVPFHLIQSGKHIMGKEEFSVLIEDENTFSISGENFDAKKVAFNTDFESTKGKWRLVPASTLKKFTGTRINVKVVDYDKYIKSYSKTLSVRLMDKSAPTIGLFITDVIPERGKDFLNTLINAYNAAAAKEERSVSKSTIAFIDERLSSLTVELGNAESMVEGYRSSQGITDLTAQSKVYLENVQTNDSKLNDVNVQLSNIAGIEKYVNTNNQSVSATTLGIGDEVLNGLVNNLTQLQLKRVAMLTTTPEGNPLFEPVNMQIKATKAAIRDNIAGKKAALKSEKSTLESINQKFESSIKEIPGKERMYIGMKRQETIKEDLYVYLLQKREELALSYASTQADARIVDQASTGDVKWPRPPLVAIIVLLLGIGVPFSIIYFRNAFNRKITLKEEIEDELGIPLLGELSLQDAGGEVIVTDSHRNITGEQLRSIRTKVFNLRETFTGDPHALSNPMAKITLCTSSTVSEGKSFVASNLAVSFALSGRKTILLEMDLRKPRIAAIFNIQKGVLGVSEFLSGRAKRDEIVQPSATHENLTIIPAGKILNNPSELLEGVRLAELIADLKTHYDEIIIDSPPIHLVTDALIIARLADVCLYIIRQGYTDKNELEYIKQLSLSGQIPNMQVIFNGITNGKYGYGYNYDNSYYLKRTPPAGFKHSWKLFTDRL